MFTRGAGSSVEVNGRQLPRQHPVPPMIEVNGRRPFLVSFLQLEARYRIDHFQSATTGESENVIWILLIS